MKTVTESDDLAARADAEAAPRPARAREADRVGQTLGHFRLLSLLGRGGMGEVYLADDVTLRRRVALKVLPAAVAADPERRRRFLREARSASAVTHPSVAAVFEAGEDGADLYLAMEYVTGAGRRAHGVGDAPPARPDGRQRRVPARPARAPRRLSPHASAAALARIIHESAPSRWGRREF
jgi:serine/threonine-protein kinase